MRAVDLDLTVVSMIRSSMNGLKSANYLRHLSGIHVLLYPTDLPVRAINALHGGNSSDAAAGERQFDDMLLNATVGQDVPPPDDVSGFQLCQAPERSQRLVVRLLSAVIVVPDDAITSEHRDTGVDIAALQR
jgi:hypothetical protein